MFRRLRDWLASHWLPIRVVAGFFGRIVVFFALLTYEPFVRHVDFAAGLARASAWASWWLLRGLGVFLGYDVVRDGTILGAGQFRVDVSPACSGAVPTMIYLSAVLAYPASLRSKAVGAGLGVVVINSLNLIRVVALFLIGLYASHLFHDTHVYIAQALVVAAAVAVWLFWAARFADVAGR